MFGSDFNSPSRADYARYRTEDVAHYLLDNQSDVSELSDRMSDFSEANSKASKDSDSGLSSMNNDNVRKSTRRRSAAPSYELTPNKQSLSMTPKSQSKRRGKVDNDLDIVKHATPKRGKYEDEKPRRKSMGPRMNATVTPKCILEELPLTPTSRRKSVNKSLFSSRRASVQLGSLPEMVSECPATHPVTPKASQGHRSVQLNISELCKIGMPPK